MRHFNSRNYRKTLQLIKLDGIPIREIATKVLVFGILLVYGAAGCSPHYPDYPQMQPTAYKSHTEQHDLSLAAKALTDPKEVKKYFGANILKDGILPVHVVIVNGSKKDSYILLKENVGLLDSSEISSTKRRNVGHDAKAMHDVGLILLSPLISAIGDTQAIGQTENFALKEFQRESIDPGQSVSGFIYFNRPDTCIDALNIRITLLQPLTRQEITVDLKLQGD